MFSILPSMVAATDVGITTITGAVGFRNIGVTGDYSANSSQTPLPKAPRAWAILVEIDDLPTTKYLAALSDAGLIRGWSIRLNGAELSANIGNGGLRQTPTENISSWAGDETIHGIVCTYSGHTGSGDLNLYTDRNLVQSASFTGFTDSTVENFTIGGHSQGNYSFRGKVYGFVACDTVPSLADVQQWFDSCKEAVDVVEFVSGSSQVWSVRRGADGIPSWWHEESGVGVSCAPRGSPARFENTSSLWGW